MKMRVSVDIITQIMQNELETSYLKEYFTFNEDYQ